MISIINFKLLYNTVKITCWIEGNIYEFFQFSKVIANFKQREKLKYLFYSFFKFCQKIISSEYIKSAMVHYQIDDRCFCEIIAIMENHWSVVLKEPVKNFVKLAPPLYARKHESPSIFCSAILFLEKMVFPLGVPYPRSNLFFIPEISNHF